MTTTPTPCLFWTCDPDTERLHCESVSDAVHEHYEDSDPELTLDEWIAEQAPLKVYGFDRMAIADDAKAYAERALERFADAIDEDYGGEDNDDSARWVVLPKEAETKLLAALTVAFREALASCQSWRCEQVKEVALSADEVRTILGKVTP